VFTEQVGGSTEVAGDRGTGHFDVMAFSVHPATTDTTPGCFGISNGVEINNGELKDRIGIYC
jgi:hypothetical protein